MGAHIIPTLKYKDAVTAIEWLNRAFGFERHLVVPGASDCIAHAQLKLGTDMIMLSSVGDTHFDTLQTTPGAVGGVGTQSAYIVISDIDAHCQRAAEALSLIHI